MNAGRGGDGAEARFVDVDVVQHDAIPDDVLLRFKLAGEPRPLPRLFYEPETGPDVWCRVEGRDEDEAPVPAMVVEVEDSSAGISALVYGGRHGLRMIEEDGGAVHAEAYLLLAVDQLPAD